MRKCREGRKQFHRVLPHQLQTALLGTLLLLAEAATVANVHGTDFATRSTLQQVRKHMWLDSGCCSFGEFPTNNLQVQLENKKQEMETNFLPK